MSIFPEEVKKLIGDFEGQTVDCKSYQILSHVDDLAKLMVAFGNNKFVCSDYGGRIIIGVDDTKNIENFEVKQGHEELIMNVARDKCYPSIHPIFEKVDLDGKSVYVITILKMQNLPYQLLTNQGKTFRIRVGSTIREPTSVELEALFDKNLPSSDDRFSKISASFPPTNMSNVRITMIPIDLNSKLFSLDRNTVTWLYSNQPRYAEVSETRVVQNELHYVKGESAWPRYAIINESGAYSYREYIRDEQKMISFARQAVLVFAICNFIKRLYLNYGYKQRIYVRCSYDGVENYKLGTEDWSEFNFEGFRAQRSTFAIERTVSLETLNCRTLTGSILDELIRACNGAINPGEFDSYVNKIYARNFPQ